MLYMKYWTDKLCLEIIFFSNLTTPSIVLKHPSLIFSFYPINPVPINVITMMKLCFNPQCNNLYIKVHDNHIGRSFVEFELHR